MSGLMIVELVGSRQAAFEFGANALPLEYAIHFDIEGDLGEQVIVTVHYSDGSEEVPLDTRSRVAADLERLCSHIDLRVSSVGSTSLHSYSEWLILDYHISLPVVPGARVRSLPHVLDQEIAWDDLRLLAGSPELSGKLQEARESDYDDEAWEGVQRDFSGFIRQAETYYRAAKLAGDATASLLFYYSFLNLAKAELLQWKPGVVHRQTPGHGCRYTPNVASMSNWKLNLRNQGIFPSLYEKRLGFSFRGPQNVHFTELAGRCYEVSSELHALGIPVKAAAGYFSVVTDGQSSAARMFLHNFSVIEENDPARAAVLDAFTKIEHSRSRDVRRDFSLSSRAGAVGATILERDRRESVGVGPVGNGRFVSNLLVMNHCDGVLAELKGVIEAPRVDYDLVLTPSLSEGMLAPLPPSLARYLAMFVVASLVRYQPGAIDPMYEPRQSWFVNAFVRQSAPLLLVEAASQIGDMPVYFEPDTRS